jgi:uncharacterized protein (TIGR02001 family)
MKKLVICLTVLATLALGASAALAEEKDGWKVDAAAAYSSKYIWRGIMQVDDPVLQPSLNLNKGGFTFNVWGSYDLTNKNNHKNNFTEIDLTAEYAFSFGDLSLPVGIINYQFPNTRFNSTSEIYAGASYNWIITPTLKVYQDIDEAHGEYVNLALAYTYDLPAPAADVTWGLALGLAGGWASKDNNKFYWGIDEDMFTDALGTIGLPIKIKEFVTITPAYNHVWLLDSKVKEVAGYDDKGYFGVTVSFAF